MSDSRLDRYAADLAAAGISTAEAERQIELLREPPAAAELVRPCTVGDGLRVLSESEWPGLEASWREAAAAGRFSKLVPASGAASRMFARLEEVRSGPSLARRALAERAAGGDAAAAAVDMLLSRIDDLPFAGELARTGALHGRDLGGWATSDDYPRVLDAILGDDGLGFARRPKALIPFHRYAEGSLTAFDEQLAEARDYLRSGGARASVHFTVSEDSLGEFEAAAAGSVLARGCEITWSTHHVSTSPLTLETDGGPARTATGSLLLRPGGHGALLRNLAAHDGDLVYLKNIDNVLPEWRREPVVSWQRLLGGLAAQLAARARRLLRELLAGGSPAVVEEAVAFCRDAIGREPPTGDFESTRAALIDLLDRPLRVCGMVPNAGEPGGGPFWVRTADGGAHPQIVEAAQVDRTDPEQERVFSSSTHFNPVMIVAALRRHDGTAHALDRFVDPRAVFVSRKPFEGRVLTVLERPGLWNGAMAGWNTVFVEVPLDTFAPVKTVLDLLRPAHQRP